MRGCRFLSVLALAVIGLLVAGAAFAAKKNAFEPGLYVGRTSQGEPVRLKVVGCGANQCVEALESAETIIQLPCPSLGESSSETFFPALNRIRSNGAVEADQSGFAKVVAALKVTHHGTMTGKIRATETLEDGARCDSGNVTFAAKIGGSTR